MRKMEVHGTIGYYDGTVGLTVSQELAEEIIEKVLSVELCKAVNSGSRLGDIDNISDIVDSIVSVKKAIEDARRHAEEKENAAE